MEIANTRVRLNKVGSDVPLNDITPAEAMLLHILHGAANGGSTFGEEFEKLTVTGTAKVKEGEKLRDRTDAEELARLRAKYSMARNNKNEPIVNTVWPDRFNPKLPQKFSEIKWKELANAGVEVAAVNYATGNLATAKL